MAPSYPGHVPLETPPRRPAPMSSPAQGTSSNLQFGTWNWPQTADGANGPGSPPHIKQLPPSSQAPRTFSDMWQSRPSRQQPETYHTAFHEPQYAVQFERPPPPPQDTPAQPPVLDSNGNLAEELRRMAGDLRAGLPLNIPDSFGSKVNPAQERPVNRLPAPKPSSGAPLPDHKDQVRQLQGKLSALQTSKDVLERDHGELKQRLQHLERTQASQPFHNSQNGYPLQQSSSVPSKSSALPEPPLSPNGSELSKSPQSPGSPPSPAAQQLQRQKLQTQGQPLPNQSGRPLPEKREFLDSRPEATKASARNVTPPSPTPSEPLAPDEIEEPLAPSEMASDRIPNFGSHPASPARPASGSPPQFGRPGGPPDASSDDDLMSQAPPEDSADELESQAPPEDEPVAPETNVAPPYDNSNATHVPTFGRKGKAETYNGLPPKAVATQPKNNAQPAVEIATFGKSNGSVAVSEALNELQMAPGQHEPPPSPPEDPVEQVARPSPGKIPKESPERKAMQSSAESVNQSSAMQSPPLKRLSQSPVQDRAIPNPKSPVQAITEPQARSPEPSQELAPARPTQAPLLLQHAKVGSPEQGILKPEPVAKSPPVQKSNGDPTVQAKPLSQPAEKSPLPDKPSEEKHPAQVAQQDASEVMAAAKPRWQRSNVELKSSDERSDAGGERRDTPMSPEANSQASTTGSLPDPASSTITSQRSREEDSGSEAAPEVPVPKETELKAGAPPQGRPGSHDQDAKDDGEDPPDGWKKQKLADGVWLLKGYMPKERVFRYKLKNGKLARLEFTTDISKSTNAEFKSPSGLDGESKCTAVVGANITEELCSVGAIDKSLSFKIGLGFSWMPQPLDREEVKELSTADEKRRGQLANMMKRKKIIASELKTADAIRAACEKEKVSRFIDAEFFPDDSALFKDPAHPDGPPVVWKRPSEFLTGEIAVISDGVKPSDIQQGALGDCWYLAALAALAEQPRRVLDLFGGIEYNALGVYEVHCFKNGRKTVVILDDLFPCSPASGKPCYAHVEGNELWVLLLEKAWAKLHGSYEQIEAGMPYRALMDLLGAAGREYVFETERQAGGLIANDSFFQLLSDYDKSRFDMTAATPGVDNLTKGEGEKPESGLVPGHAYTLISVQESNGVRLAKLRNPWGDCEWSGDWSDASLLWTPEMKQVFKPSFDKHDGEFWMDEVDFLTHFTSVGVVFFNKHWSCSRMALTTSGSDTCKQVIQIHVKQKAAGFFTLSQKDTRIVGTPPYTRLSFAVYGPLENDGLPSKEVLRSELWPVRELVEEVHEDTPLMPGSYVIAVFNPQQVPDRELTVTIQLEEGVKEGDADVRSTQIASLRDLDDDLKQALAFSSATGSKASKKGKMGPLVTTGGFTPSNGYSLAAQSDRAVTVDFDFSHCKGLQLNDENKISVAFEPGQPKLVGELKPLGSGGKVSYGVSASWTEEE